jgi:hypothetical protein
MSENIESAIDEVQQRIVALQKEVTAQKRAVNILCGIVGREPLYAGADIEESHHQTATTRDLYYGQDIADVIEDILRRRKQASKGSATVSEIYDAMKAGGFRFDAKNDDNAKRGVYISLGRNAKFHKLPDGSYGLALWYPAIKVKKAKNGDDAEGDEVKDKPEADSETADVATNDGAVAEPDAVPVGATAEPLNDSQAKRKKAK